MRERDDRGSVTIWLANASLAMVLLVGLAVDLGGHVHAEQRAHDVAAQAARAGAEQVQAAPAIEGRTLAIDASAARAAAQRYLAAADVEGQVKIVNDETITVTVTDTYAPRFLRFLGTATVSATASARLVRSVGGTER